MSTLYIVASPIGNLGDISQRAIETLKSVNTIFAEDTRVTSKILNHFEIQGKKLTSLNKDNEQRRINQVLEVLAKEDTVLISDAGTPLISDPGALLLKDIYKEGHMVSPIPGASALTAFLSICPLDSTGFIFEAFLPHGPKQRRRVLKKLIEENLKRPIVFFESPHRIKKTLEDIKTLYSEDIEIFIARELTKIYEQTYFGPIGEVLNQLQEQFPKDVQGEFVLMIQLNA
jgi:16S rRNA (cytidine1402-2'-O)-methyltransferase